MPKSSLSKSPLPSLIKGGGILPGDDTYLPLYKKGIEGGFNSSELIIRTLSLQDYGLIWEAMQDFTATRSENTPDELWLLQHSPVFTLGLNSKPEHLRDPGDIPVIHTDRGGQVTYHGPGQLIAYVLIDLQRRGWGVRRFVNTLEQAVIDLLADYGIKGDIRSAAPGVYVNDAKIAALGLRVRRGKCYHGLSLNVAMDLTPFQRINPCGYPTLSVTQLGDLGGPADLAQVETMLAKQMTQSLGYNKMLGRSLQNSI